MRTPIRSSCLGRRLRTPTTSCSDSTRCIAAARCCGPVNSGLARSSTGCRTKAGSEPPTRGPMPPLDALVARVFGEYCEMPGLRLTISQACRLWHVDVSTCEMLFTQLVREGFLYKTEKSAYIAQPTTRKRI